MLPENRPVLCLITDRRRLAAALRAKARDHERLLLDQIAGAISGGIDVVQIRERDLEGAALAALTRKCVALTAASSTRVVVNDRLDVAIATDAHGVHLREDSVAIEAAARLGGEGRLIGRSVHSGEGARAAGRANYLIAGSVFPTPSKPDAVALGLRAVVRCSSRPVWGVGGITADRLAMILRVGARGMAGIGAFIPPAPVPDLVVAVQKLAAELRFGFDSSAGVT